MISRLRLIHRNQGLILEVARIRSLSQELSSAYLLVELNMSTPEALLEGGGKGSRERVVKNGSGSLKMKYYRGNPGLVVDDFIVWGFIDNLLGVFV